MITTDQDSHPRSPLLRRFLPRGLPSVLMVGLAGGLIGIVYVLALHFCESLLSPDLRDPWTHVGVMTAVGLAVALITKYVGTPGDVELLVNNIHVLGGSRDLRDLPSLLPISLLCIASGGGLGPEAPLVQTTGTLGAWVADRRGLDVINRRVMAITGMAAGFTVLFGAPLGAAIFALEILHRRGLEYYEALMPAIIGSLCGFLLFTFATGMGLQPVWEFAQPEALLRMDFIYAAGAAVAGTVVAVLFIAGVNLLRRVFSMIPRLIRPIAGGLGLGLLGCWTPWALTYGEFQVQPLLAAVPTAATLLVAAAGKFIGTSLTISCGWRGGFIIPLFFIGAALGRLWHMQFPESNEIVVICAFMAAINTGVTKTPLGTTLVVSGMAGLTVLPTTLLASLLALLLTRGTGLFTTQQPREGKSDQQRPSEPDLGRSDH